MWLSALKGFIPGTILLWQIEPFQLTEVSGSMNGKINYNESRVVGYCVENNAGGKNYGAAYNKLLGNSSDFSIEMEGKIEPSFGI